DRRPAQIDVQAPALVLLLARLLARERSAALDPAAALDEEVPLAGLADARAGGLEDRVPGEAHRAGAGGGEVEEGLAEDEGQRAQGAREGTRHGVAPIDSDTRERLARAMRVTEATPGSDQEAMGTWSMRGDGASARLTGAAARAASRGAG